MATTTALRTRPNGPPASPAFHATCWRILSAATAAGCPPVSYRPAGEPLPEGHAELECLVCGDSWVIPSASPWLLFLRLRLLTLALDPAASGAA